MTEEEYFRKNYPDYCYGDRLLSPYWDLFQDGVEFGERQSEEKIEELKKENTELKSEKGCETCTKFDEVKLTKAKEILQTILDKWKEERWILQSEKEVKQIENLMKQVEQFIKEIEKCQSQKKH